MSISTYSPVENIPTVNTMQAHDRNGKKSIEEEKQYKYSIVLCVTAALSAFADV